MNKEEKIKAVEDLKNELVEFLNPNGDLSYSTKMKKYVLILSLIFIFSIIKSFNRNLVFHE